MTKGLLELDLKFARQFAGDRALEFTDDDLLISMHRARYDRPELPMTARRESAAWLIDRGLDDLHGMRVVMPWADACAT